ncbi:MAG: hypothetical protein CL670_10740 [Balneola sp.]|jgi:hypothetical protein|nr:hypothetical protein [Balneola sp.]MBE79622.1 hypothetical protein [Balneola sp.]|tara:strand:+ start:78150 stop:79685 length:1536 start_codon:yes stop_codon:yes gene_type:complete
MRRRLCIAIQKRTPDWDAVLNYLGVWFEQVDYSKSLAQNYSVIILNDQPESDQVELLKVYLNNSGSILEIEDNLIFTKKSDTKNSSVQTLTRNTRHKSFEHISFVDLFENVRLHNDSELFEGLIHFQKQKKGAIGFFGANLASLTQQSGYMRKRFYSSAGENPDEIVSKVSKHELLELFAATLKELHYHQGLPFISKWTSPTEKPVFGFRVDSDFGDQKSIHDLYDVLKRHDIAGTWFLHVEAHEEWLNHFKEMEKQEIALHGYEHGTSSSYHKTVRNIEIGEEKLEEAGINIDGFCAPYGIWNEALEKSLSEKSFVYSSEFTLAYDGYPVEPANENLPLQIPIHPICTGSLNRRRYSYSDMEVYFEQVLNQKLGRFEPVFFYHHPLQPGLDVIDAILKKVSSLPFENLTFSEYAGFWKRRKEFKFEAWSNDGMLEIQSDSQQNVLLQVSTSMDGFDLTDDTGSNIDLPKTPKFKYSNSYLLESEQVHKLRNKDLRLLKTSLLDWKNRIKL